jgi:hypothetical protein
MKTETIPAKDGYKAIHFKKGGLHETTHTPMKEKIPRSKVIAAMHGAYGKRGVKQANFMMNVLHGK